MPRPSRTPAPGSTETRTARRARSERASEPAEEDGRSRRRSPKTPSKTAKRPAVKEKSNEPPRFTPADYARIKEEAGARRREASVAGRDIGELPAVEDLSRKAAALKSFKKFARTYFPHRFYLTWSPDHIAAMDRMEKVAIEGGLDALAMPRGSGKTSMVEVLVLYLVLKGIAPFVLLMGSSRAHALEMLLSIKSEIEGNEKLQADFPEVCFPIQKLEGITNRCAGQLHNGERTHISWKKDEIVFPTIAGSLASGAILKVVGLTGRFRGMKHVRPDGRSVRPTHVVLDDPQTDKSARSVSQCDQRERLISGGVLGLAGPGQKLCAIMLCTVIQAGDLSSRMLDRDRHPQWYGQRFKMLYAFPKHMQLWEDYAVKRADDFRNGGDGAAATAFYRADRKAMDEGAVVAWPERHNPDELSGIQHAMNLFFRDKYAFFAEAQNDPQREDLGEDQLAADAIAARVSGLARGVVPLKCTRLTAFVDVQKTALYWMVCAWADDFTGSVIDYGTWPDQQRRYFTLAEVQRTLSKETAGGLQAAIYHALGKCADQVLREYAREDGIALRIARLIVDANWGDSTDTVYAWCRQTPHAGLVLPSHGRFVGAKSKPWSQYQKKEGERLGLHWLIPAGTGKRAIRPVFIDTNWWKSFCAERLTTAIGDKGALTLYGQAGQDHRMLADHFTSEYFVKVKAQGRTVAEWSERPGKPDNHWFDCLVGCAAAASIEGATLVAGTQAPTVKREVVSFAEQQRQAWEKDRRRRRAA